MPELKLQAIEGEDGGLQNKSIIIAPNSLPPAIAGLRLITSKGHELKGRASMNF
ncbi:MAG: hypothetical protein WAS28_07845 [Saprospiraceae bacterium]